MTQRIISLMFSTGRAISKQYFEELKRKNRLSVLQLEALRHVRENKEVLMKDLAKYLFITPPSVTSLVDDLAIAKLVKRSEDKKDRRIIAISLTQKGKKTLAGALERKMEKVGKKIDTLTASEKKALLKILEKLSKVNNQ